LASKDGGINHHGSDKVGNTGVTGTGGVGWGGSCSGATFQPRERGVRAIMGGLRGGFISGAKPERMDTLFSGHGRFYLWPGRGNKKGGRGWKFARQLGGSCVRGLYREVFTSVREGKGSGTSGGQGRYLENGRLKKSPEDPDLNTTAGSS